MAILRRPIRQVAYSVPDIRAAAEAHHALYGSGPFFIAEHVPVQNFRYRGSPGKFDHSTIFGQWGEIMVEFFVQHNPGPSQGHDMYPYGSGKSGFHHIALIVEDLEREKNHFIESGFEIATEFTCADAFDVVMVDTRKANGHMVELYMNVPAVSAAYKMTREAAQNFTSGALITPIAFG